MGTIDDGGGERVGGEKDRKYVKHAVIGRLRDPVLMHVEDAEGQLLVEVRGGLLVLFDGDGSEYLRTLPNPLSPEEPPVTVAWLSEERDGKFEGLEGQANRITTGPQGLRMLAGKDVDSGK